MQCTTITVSERSAKINCCGREITKMNAFFSSVPYFSSASAKWRELKEYFCRTHWEKCGGRSLVIDCGDSEGFW